jgi:hypothetical protein
MVIAALAIALVVVLRWQIVHVHAHKRDRAWFDQYAEGDTLTYRGCRATVIYKGAHDMVIRRHLIGLVKRESYQRIERAK